MINGEIMGTVAIVLIVIGIICVIISIILGITDNKEQADTASYVSDYDSPVQLLCGYLSVTEPPSSAVLP